MDENNECTACELQDNLAILRETRFFSQIPLETLKVLAYLCNRDTFKNGEKLFRQGENDGQAFFILEGKATLLRKDDDAGEYAIREYGAGDFLGSLTLLGNSPRLFTLKATEDTVCLIITRQKFLRILDQFPDLTPRIFRAVTDSITAWEETFLIHSRDECKTCRKHIGVSTL